MLQKNVTIFENGHYVSRSSDWIMYSVEAKNIDAIVARYGPSTKMGAIVGGQTSTKAPEIAAFEKHLPADVEIVSCHSLHGPGVNPKGQPLVIINHRASQKSVDLVEKILSCFESTFVPLSAEKHDRITADTQAVTHLAFLSMGTAWCANDQFPWEVPRYIGGIENVKINLMMRIYSNKWHVYAGLAILNPAAKAQIRQYAESVTDLYKMMLSGQTEQFSERIYAARDAVFGADAGTKKQKKSSSGGNDDEDEEEEELLLEDELLDKFSLGDKPQQRVKNNHLSLLAIVDCWWKLGIVPYDHMICSTPVGFHSPLPLPPPLLPASQPSTPSQSRSLLTDMKPKSSSASGSASPSTSTALPPYSPNASTQPSTMYPFAPTIWNSRLRRATGPSACNWVIWMVIGRSLRRFKNILLRGSRMPLKWGMK